jgi:hypothetical protein
MGFVDLGEPLAAEARPEVMVSRVTERYTLVNIPDPRCYTRSRLGQCSFALESGEATGFFESVLQETECRITTGTNYDTDIKRETTLIDYRMYIRYRKSGR